MKQNKIQFNTRLSKETIEILQAAKKHKKMSMAVYIEKAVANYKHKILRGVYEG